MNYHKLFYNLLKYWRELLGSIITISFIKDDRRETLTYVDNIVSYDCGTVGFRNGHGESANKKY